MADSPEKRRVYYSKELDTTYEITPGGGTNTYSGDLRGDPMFTQDSRIDQNPKGLQLKPDPGSAANSSGLGKDILVNLASALGSAAPGGVLGRIIGSMGLGMGAESIINPNSTTMDKLGNTGLNTLIGEILPLALERTRINIPGFNRTTVDDIEHGATRFTRSGTNTGKVSGSGNTSGGSRFASEGASETIGSGTSTSKGNSRGSSTGSSATESSGTSATIGEQASKRTTITQKFEDEIPPTDHMVSIQKEIDRMKAIEPKNKSQATAINNAISKQQDALDALHELNRNEGTISRSEGSGTSSQESSRSNKGTSTRTGTSEQSSNAESSNLQESKGASSNRGESSSQSSNTHTSQSSGEQFQEGLSQQGPSRRVSQTTGTAPGVLGIIQNILGTRITKGQPLTPLERILVHLGFNTLADTTVNSRK